MTITDSTKLWTATFALLCVVQLLGYAQQAMLNPTVPLYITDLNGSPFVVGLTISSFAATSVIARPFVGYWSDRWSECGVLGFGLLMLAVSMLLWFFPLVPAVLLANALRGIGWAGVNAGGYALLARIAPQSRRGEASGYYSGAQSTPTVIFPAVALWLLQAPFGGYNLVFIIMIALGLGGAAVCYLMARQISTVRRPSDQPQSAAPWWRQIITLSERGVLLPASLMFCNQLSFPAITSFIVLYTREIGIDSIGSYFIVSGITSVLARPMLGRVSDRIGVGYSLVATFTLQSLALTLLVVASNLAMILLAGVLYMLGMAIGGASTLIIAMNRATPERRGRFMASFSMAYPLGYGLGAFITGSAIDVIGYSSTYLLLAVLGAVGLLLTMINWKFLK
ncbi:MAG TPA: MFS transporter [Candidatus Binatia bacterium]|nr:MFS transporter [Candidatus Binatia bacterium]